MSRLSSTLGVLCTALFLFLLTPAPLAAQPQQELRVATRVLPPLVVQEGDALSGFSIELWNAIGERLKLPTRYEVAPNISALLAMVREGRADLGIAAISITAAREAEFDFSQPMFNAGLQIMVRGKGADTDSSPLFDLLRLLNPRILLMWMGIAALLIIIPAHIVFFVERRHPSTTFPSRDYFPGIFHALFWAWTALGGQAEHMPRQWLARIMAALWMFVGVVFVAFYTAQLTASLTVQQIQGAINGPEDLPGKRVVTTRGSTAAAALREMRVQIKEVERIEDAYASLMKGENEAVVFDAPVLLYHAANAGKGQVQLVGAPFRKEDYGIVFPSDSKLRKQVNAVLLSLREDGTYQRLYDKWFATK